MKLAPTINADAAKTKSDERTQASSLTAITADTHARRLHAAWRLSGDYIQPVRDSRHATVAVNNPTATINKTGLDITVVLSNT